MIPKTAAGLRTRARAEADKAKRRRAEAERLRSGVGRVKLNPKGKAPYPGIERALDNPMLWRVKGYGISTKRFNSAQAARIAVLLAQAEGHDALAEKYKRQAREVTAAGKKVVQRADIK